MDGKVRLWKLVTKTLKFYSFNHPFYFMLSILAILWYSIWIPLITGHLCISNFDYFEGV